MFFALLFQHFSQPRICCDPAGEHYAFLAPFEGGIHRLCHYHLQDGFLESRRYVGNVQLSSLLLLLVYVVEDAGLDAAEAEVVASLLEIYPLEVDRLPISFFGDLIYKGTARISEAEDPSTLSYASPAASSLVDPSMLQLL